MPEILGWLVIFAIVLHTIGVIDITIDVAPHVNGEKVICIRGKER